MILENSWRESLAGKQGVFGIYFAAHGPYETLQEAPAKLTVIIQWKNCRSFFIREAHSIVMA